MYSANKQFRVIGTECKIVEMPSFYFIYTVPIKQLIFWGNRPYPLAKKSPNRMQSVQRR